MIPLQIFVSVTWSWQSEVVEGTHCCVGRIQRIMLALIKQFFFLFFGGRPPRFFDWMTAKKRLILCAPAFVFVDAASNGFFGGAFANEELRF